MLPESSRATLGSACAGTVKLYFAFPTYSSELITKCLFAAVRDGFLTEAERHILEIWF